MNAVGKVDSYRTLPHRHFPVIRITFSSRVEVARHHIFAEYKYRTESSGNMVALSSSSLLTEASVKRPVGRPRDPTKVEALLDAAWALFIERGVEAVPMEAIATRAGVSKSTLYSIFSDKTALFEAAMLREMERIEAAQGVTPTQGVDEPFGDTLRAFGIGIMNFLASDVGVGFYGALSAEIRRHPDLSRAFWDLGPGRTRTNLTRLMTAAADRGDIKVGDPVLAAEALFGLWLGFSQLQLTLDGGTEEVRSSVADRVDRGIQIFLRAFAHLPT